MHKKMQSEPNCMFRQLSEKQFGKDCNEP